MVIDQKRIGKEREFFELCKKVLDGGDVSLYDLEYASSSKTLKIFIVNRETGSAKIEECAELDNALSPYFEVESWIPEGIRLEVSSPGIFRKLKTFEHFSDVLLQTIDIALNRELSKIDGCQDIDLPKTVFKSRKVRGKLTEVDKLGVKLEIGDSNVFISYEYIKSANLSPDINY